LQQPAEGCIGNQAHQAKRDDRGVAINGNGRKVTTESLVSHIVDASGCKDSVYEWREDLLGVRGQDIEPGSAMGLVADRRIAEDQGCPRSNQCTDILQKLRIDRDPIFESLQIWLFSADADGGDPVTPSAGVGIRIGRANIRAGIRAVSNPATGARPISTPLR
jgi:hypothetical protein